MSKKPWYYADGYPPVLTKFRVENRHVGRLHGWAVRTNWNESKQIVLAAHAKVGDDLLLLPEAQQKQAQEFNRKRYELEDEYVKTITGDAKYDPWKF